eukprot:Opistho-1_new@27481
MSRRLFRVVGATNETMAFKNCALVSEADFPDLGKRRHIRIRPQDPRARAVMPPHGYIVTICADKDINDKSREVLAMEPRMPVMGFNVAQRESWMKLANKDVLEVEPFDPVADGGGACIAAATLEIDFFRSKPTQPVKVTTDALGPWFVQEFSNCYLQKNEWMAFKYENVIYGVRVVKLELIDLDAVRANPGGAAKSIPEGEFGVLLNESVVRFVKAPDSQLRLEGKDQTQARTAIINPNWNFEQMGIGGLDTQFSNIFRRAFASRVFPPELLKQLGITHVKGILLYGPPGTGKTLMARQIGKMLNARPPKIVNGPEILSKYVGESEKNIRELFADAEKEFKAKGEDSALHIIIFDEIDAICKQRGSRNDNTGVHDTVVNQLLSKMDGVDQLDNVLVIGMTNRKDMIDEALTRPGRLEVEMEISLPDEHGRVQILKIHTSQIKTSNRLADDVDLLELAALTKNYSGAELAGVVRSASSFAMNRLIKAAQKVEVNEDASKNLKVTREDFLNALEEVKPAFGSADETLGACIRNGIISWGPEVQRVLDDGKLFVQQVSNSDRTPLVTVLLEGPTGSGKTALAARLAMDSQFPFVKIISPEKMVGYSESAKCSAITKVFDDSYKSPLSVIVVDDIERLLEYAPIGPRFSNAVLQTLMVLFKKQPPKGKRLLVFATTSRHNVMADMGLADSFDASLKVPNLTKVDQITKALMSLEVFSADDWKRFNERQATVLQNVRLWIGIKKLIMLAEMARQDAAKVDRFLESLRAACLENPDFN